MPFILINLVLSTRVESVGGSKKVEVEGVSAGGTRSMPALCRNLTMWGPWSNVHEWSGCLVRRTPQTPVEASLNAIGPYRPSSNSLS